MKRNNIHVNLVHSHVFNISKGYLQACKLTNHSTLSPRLTILSETLKVTILRSSSSISSQKRVSSVLF
jgi:hypothetical protein